MKRIAIVLMAALLLSLCVPAFAEADKPFEGTELVVYNWYDYMDEDSGFGNAQCHHHN